MLPNGAVRIVTGFSGGADGEFPNAVAHGRDGRIYGTTHQAEPTTSAWCFRIDLHVDEVAEGACDRDRKCTRRDPVEVAWSDVPNAAHLHHQTQPGVRPGSVLARNILGTMFVMVRSRSVSATTTL